MVMRRCSMVPAVAVLALVAGVAGGPRAAMAQQKVASVDIIRVFNEMQETKDTAVRFRNDAQSLQTQLQQKQADLENLKNTRDQLKPDSAQWQEANQKFMQAQMEGRIWQELRGMELQRQQKLQSKLMFDHIDAAVAEVAKAQGFDLVLNVAKPDLTKMMEEPQVNLVQLQATMAQRNVLFSDAKNDITNQVIAALDAKYKSAPKK